MSIDNFEDRSSDILKKSYEKSRVDEDCKNLVAQYSYPDGISPYIARLKSAEEIPENSGKINSLGWMIEINTDYRGFGLVSLTQSTAEREDAATAYVANRFIASAYRPVIVPIDQLYTYFPEYLPGFVKKTKMFSSTMRDMYPNQKFVVIVSGFSSSALFTPDVLSIVPSQDNAGIDRDGGAEDRNAMRIFADSLVGMISAAHGNLGEVVNNITKYSKSEKLAKLIVAMGLLMQDAQAWQGLWYPQGGAPLIIVAPEDFHDAMTRLNLYLGHGAGDYRSRAQPSFGYTEFPEHTSDHVYVDYNKQGMSAQEFERSVLPILRKLRAEQKPSFD